MNSISNQIQLHMDADESPGYEDTMLELGAMVPGRSEYGVVGSKAQPDVDIDDYDLEAEYDVELMLQNHDDPAIDVLYVETRRRGIGPADGSVDETSMADGMLLLDDDADEMEPIAPRRESIDSPTEDWDIELGVDEEIKEAQQEMASGFRSLISLGVDKTSAAVSDSRLRYLDDVENETLGNILSDELTKIQSIMPVP